MGRLTTGPLDRFADWRMRLRRQMVDSDRPALALLALLNVGLVVGGVLDADLFPLSAILVPVFLGTLWLGPKTLPWFVTFCMAGVVVMLLAQPSITTRTVSRVVIVFGIGLMVMITSFRRARLGVSGPRGESMFVDLRDRIVKQGTIPALPPEWQVEAATRSAGGASFGGDFLVASRATDGSTVELIVVDVSGKGVEAGTRSLLLSGAFGGLASSVPPEDFLSAANEYLLRQNWDEGFATAIHLHLCLVNGEFELRKAGHPPAVWLHAGSGRWSTLDSDGPVLGLIPDTNFESVTGTLLPGDALLMYTDGLVETTRRDIGSGIDKLAGRGQRLFRTGFTGGARAIIDELATANDDGALVMVHRRAALMGER